MSTGLRGPISQGDIFMIIMVYFEENTKSKAINLAFKSFGQDLMAIKVAYNGYLMPIIYPNYL